VKNLNWTNIYWWVDHLATIFSIPLALIGFGITIWQLKKTKSAAEAAQDAAKDAASSIKDQVRAINLASLVPQLIRIENEIERAIGDGSVEILRFWIALWRQHAGEARAYLEATTTGEKRVLRNIQSSISTAADTRSRIHGLNELANLGTITEDLRKVVSRVTGELGTIAARQITAIGEGKDNGTQQ
jgi:hypothetical protein